MFLKQPCFEISTTLPNFKKLISTLRVKLDICLQKQLFNEEEEFLTKFDVEGITELYRIEKTSNEVFRSNVNIFSILKIE